MKTKNIFLGLTFVLSLSLISWGVTGHRSIAKIAENHLSPKAKAAVDQLLGTEDMPIVSTYADEIRYDAAYKYTGPWHYVNLPLGLSYEQFSAAVQADTTANVYNALLKMKAQLVDPKSNKADKVFALKMLIHFVGDLHQPMHVSREEDQGGNKIKLKFQGRDTNLHSLWDSGLIEYNGWTFTEMATALDHVSDPKIKQWQSDPIIKWLYESYQISSQLYKEVEANPELDYTYYPKHSEIYKTRIQQAGIRLAGMLNVIYK
ncbi:MAG: S1/P1 nuclease [Pelobium sp.]